LPTGTTLIAAMSETPLRYKIVASRSPSTLEALRRGSYPACSAREDVLVAADPTH
jgi:hypothetical protein